MREKHIACEFILISSYSEFRYAQEALKLGAFDYILKPIEPDALYACVKRCVEKVEKTLAPSSAMPLSPEIMTEWLRNVLVAVPAAESALQRMLGMACLLYTSWGSFRKSGAVTPIILATWLIKPTVGVSR